MCRGFKRSNLATNEIRNNIPFNTERRCTYLILYTAKHWRMYCTVYNSGVDKFVIFIIRFINNMCMIYCEQFYLLFF